MWCVKDMVSEVDEPVSSRWSSPSGCSGSGCNYVAEWTLNKSANIVSFKIAAKQSSDTWTGIGIAPEPKMVNKLLHKPVGEWNSAPNKISLTHRRCFIDYD